MVITMIKKRMTVCFLLICFTLSLAIYGDTRAGGSEEAVPIVIGISTAADGNLGLGLWSDNATSVDLRLLLHGYETVSWVRSLDVAFNKTVLKNIHESPRSDGDVEVAFELAPGLAYNNGESISARDYVFSLLLLASPELAALGAKPSRLEYLRGYEAFHAGTVNVLSGVRLLSENSFSLQVKADALSSFYGFARLGVLPYPISVIAPGCRVADDGLGAYLKGVTGGEGTTETGVHYVPGQFSTEMLAETLLDPVNGYEVNPRVTCGPYQLEEYDTVSRTAHLRVNPWFTGNYEGVMPTVERLEVRFVRSEDIISKLWSGELDIAERVSDQEAVRKGRMLLEEYGNIRAVNYPRTGQTQLAFTCERGPLASREVRRAIAMCLDKDSITRKIGGDYAQRVYAYYGKDQWMPEYESDPIDGVSLLNMARELALLDIPQDFSAAKSLLETDGWTLNHEGNPFVEDVDPMRYRMEDGRLVPLLLWMAQPEESVAAEQFREVLEESLSRVGIGLRCVQISFNELLDQLYRRQERMFDLFFYSYNFSYLFDPVYKMNPNEASLGIANKTGVQDEVLFALAKELRDTPAFDRDAYAVKWLAFQQQFVQVLPLLPLYSSTYFAFYSDRLLTYTPDEHSGWALSAPYMRIR